MARPLIELRSQLAPSQKWGDILPPVLIDYWRHEGWAGYGKWTTLDGKTQMTLSTLKDSWLKGTSLENFDKFHVIARSAFGNLYL
ncbi:hypothetical protein D0O09_32720, partial [Pseudomonas putida]